MNFSEMKRCLDRKAVYFWQKRGERYALVNAFTLKTVTGVGCRLEAIKLTQSLADAGYSVDRPDETGQEPS